MKESFELIITRHNEKMGTLKVFSTSTAQEGSRLRRWRRASGSGRLHLQGSLQHGRYSISAAARASEGLYLDRMDAARVFKIARPKDGAPSKA